MNLNKTEHENDNTLYELRNIDVCYIDDRTDLCFCMYLRAIDTMIIYIWNKYDLREKRYKFDFAIVDGRPLRFTKIGELICFMQANVAHANVMYGSLIRNRFIETTPEMEVLIDELFPIAIEDHDKATQRFIDTVNLLRSLPAVATDPDDEYPDKTEPADDETELNLSPSNL